MAKQGQQKVSAESVVSQPVSVAKPSPESLLATVRDRLEEEEPPCFYRDEALMHVTEAMRSLQRRTQARVARGVEGTSEK